jgi:hypothetical protein
VKSDPLLVTRLGLRLKPVLRERGTPKMGDNNAVQRPVNGTAEGQRRMSLTQRLIGNARDWFSGAREGPKEYPSMENKFEDQVGSEAAGGRPRSRSKSLGANVAPYSFRYENRDVIIPGPVF